MSFITEVITNNVPRFTVDGFDLTGKERKEFLDGGLSAEEIDSKTFIRYAGEVFAIDDFVRIEERSKMTNAFCCVVDEGSPLLEWHGKHMDCQVVIKFPNNDTETVIVGNIQHSRIL